MRRTWNTSVSPTIGIVIAGTGNIGFGPACASARAPCVTAPASASAPDAKIVLRSTVFIGVLPPWLGRRYLDRLKTPGKASARLPETRQSSHPVAAAQPYANDPMPPMDIITSRSYFGRPGHAHCLPLRNHLPLFSLSLPARQHQRSG